MLDYQDYTISLKYNNMPGSMMLDTEMIMVNWFPLGVSSSIDGNEGGELGTNTLKYSFYIVPINPD